MTWFGLRAKYDEDELVLMRELTLAVREGAAEEVELRLIHRLKANFPGSRLTKEDR
jgi:hypothetical protein